MRIGEKVMLSSIPVNLIRQWCYCPRVVYYLELIDIPIHRPTWVKQGKDFHQSEEKLWQRRNLSRFGLQKGKKHYNFLMKSEDLKLHGIADMIIETHNAVYPIEFKISANNKKRGDILQLAAYGMLAEMYFKKSVSLGFLVGKGKILYEVSIDENIRQQVLITRKEIHTMLERGRKPDSSASLIQCSACEYVNFCNDRL